LGLDVVGSQGAHSLVARCWWGSGRGSAAHRRGEGALARSPPGEPARRGRGRASPPTFRGSGRRSLRVRRSRRNTRRGLARIVGAGRAPATRLAGRTRRIAHIATREPGSRSRPADAARAAIQARRVGPMRPRTLPDRPCRCDKKTRAGSSVPRTRPARVQAVFSFVRERRRLEPPP
jgi:hypothetical protein